jgi:hypothetical protein
MSSSWEILVGPTTKKSQANKEDGNMVRCASLFSQLVALFNKGQFYHLVREHRSERYCKRFSSWDHFVAMLFCQLAQAKSLREICGGLASTMGKLRHLGMKDAPKKSTLSYANSHRPWEMYRDLFYQTLDLCKSAAPKKGKFRFKNKLLSLDSTTIALCLSLFPWAEFRRTKGAIKLHLLLDHEGYFPTYAYISNGNKHDVTIARKVPLPPGSIVTMDRGYNDYKLFAYWTENRISFVTRMKDNADYTVVEETTIPTTGNVLRDQLVQFNGVQAQKNCPHILRRVVVWDEKNEREIVLLSNHLKFGANTLSAIYKDRWQIELFFKALKQNLKIKTFVGTSENALRIQIWTALIAMLLIKYLQFKSKFQWSLSNLVAFLRWNLFTYRDLWEWIDRPFDVHPFQQDSVQYRLWVPGLGQHSRIMAT